MHDEWGDQSVTTRHLSEDKSQHIEEGEGEKAVKSLCLRTSVFYKINGART